jgi:hypothetical protein
MSNIVAYIIFYLLFLASFSAAQDLPETIFDNPSQAFGNNVQDVPPDILTVGTVPAHPATGQEIRVKARVKVDPEISKFKVSEAFVYYRDKAGKTGMKRVGMNRMSDQPDWWEAVIPGFPEDTEVEFFIRGIDEIGNEVIQLPQPSGAGPAEMIQILDDGEDQGIPAFMDIISVRVGYDGSDLITCMQLKGAFQTYSPLGVDTLVVGFIDNDMPRIPYTSINANTEGFMAYCPGLEMKGVYDLSQFHPDGLLRGEAKVKLNGREACIRAKVSYLISTPEHGLKIYAASSGIDVVKKQFNLGDSSPYAILHFGGRTVKVGAVLP